MEPTPKEGTTKTFLKRRNFNLRRGSQSKIKTNDVSLNKSTVKKDKENECEPVKYKAPLQKSVTPSTLTSLKSNTSGKIEIPTKKAVKLLKPNSLAAFKQKKEKKEIVYF